MKDKILQLIKNKGQRITKLRAAMIDIFTSLDSPIDFALLESKISLCGLAPNKTTIYRELDFLIAHNILEEVDFGEGKKRYELAGQHHHHLICTQCNTVQDVHLEDHLHEQEKKIFAKMKFKVTKHMLEFFGICKSCQKKGNI